MYVCVNFVQSTSLMQSVNYRNARKESWRNRVMQCFEYVCLRVCVSFPSILLFPSFPPFFCGLLSADVHCEVKSYPRSSLQRGYNVFPFKVRLTQPLSVWLPFKTNLIRQEFGLLGSGTLGSCLSEKQSEREREGEDTDVSHQEAVSISVLMGKTGPGPLMMVSHLIYLIGSQDTYKSVELWVFMWVISANCT